MRSLKMFRVKPLLLAIVMVATIGISLVGPVQTTVYASPNDDASVDTQLKSYIFMRAIARCLDKSPLRDGALSDKVDPGHASSYEWFMNVDSTETYLGMYDDPGSPGDPANGKKDCDNNDWLQQGFEIWGWTDSTQAICYSGFKRSNADDGQVAADCVKGSGDFKRDGGKSEAKNQFLKNVNKQFYDNPDSTALPTMTDAMKYWYYSQSFLTLCDPTERANPESYSDADIEADNHLFKMLDADGTTYKVYETTAKDDGDHVSTRTSDSLGQVEITCGDLVKQANQFAAAYASVVDADPTKGGSGSGSGSATGDIDTSCGGVKGVLFNPLMWIACPMIQGFTEASKVLDNAIMSMLCVDQNQIFGTSSSCTGVVGGDSTTAGAYKDAWNVFRVIALGLLAIAGLIMILSQTMGLEFIDAYTIKKVLPRLLIAAIGISLSWQLMDFFVGLTNVLGTGIRSLIYAPFTAAGINNAVLSGGTGAIVALTSIGGLAFLGPLGILSLIATALLAIFIAFLVLVLRNLVVIVLIIMAPIAIVAYILPNTQKFWSFWWDAFSKALIMFPIIAAFIAVGHVFAAIATTQSANMNGITAVIASTVGFIAYFAPYFLIPLTLRFAGGVLGTLGGFANDRNRGMFDRLKKYRGGKAASNFNRMQGGNLFKGGTKENWRGRVNRGFQYGVNASPENVGMDPRRWKSRMQSHLSTHEFDHAMEGLEKDAYMRAIAPDDDVLSAGLAGDREAAKAYLIKKGQSGRQLEQNLEAITLAKRSMGDEGFRVAATVAMAGTKTGFAGEYDADFNPDGLSANQQMANQIAATAGGDKGLAGRMYAASRAQAGRAGRIDLAGHSFGAGVTGVYDTIDGGAVDNDALNIDTFLNNDAVTIGRSDSRAVRNIMESVTKRVNALDAKTSDGSINEEEKAELGRITGAVENMRQQGFYFAPQRVQTVERALQDTDASRQSVRNKADEAQATPTTYNPTTRTRNRQDETAEGYNEQQRSTGPTQLPPDVQARLRGEDQDQP